MPEIHHLLAFAIAAFLIVIIPGPNMTFLITCAATQNRKIALFALLGSISALLTLGILTGLGLSTLIKTVPILYESLKIAGAVYFFWLAWKNISAKQISPENTIVTVLFSDRQAYKAGYFTNLLNPKAAAFYVAIFPQFMDPHLGSMVLQGAALGMVHGLVSLTVNSTIIYSVSRLSSRFQEGNKFRSIKKWGTAILFTAFGIRILMQENN
jgi:threonine/homoserine/homoserine lactone efflux protein